jgi:hypothetical protein
VSSYEHGNEPSDSIQFEKFFSPAEELVNSTEDSAVHCHLLKAELGTRFRTDDLSFLSCVSRLLSEIVGNGRQLSINSF